MGELIGHIKSEWHVMKGAPVAFVVLLILGLGVGFYGGKAWSAREITNLQTLLDIKDAQRQLSEQQLTDLKARLKQAAPAAVDILGEGPKAEQFKSAFSDSGWNVGGGQSPVDSLVLRAQDDKAVTTIQKALKDAGVSYKAVQPSDNGPTDFVLGKTK